MSTLYTYFPAPHHHFPDHPERPARLDLINLASIPGIESTSFTAASLQDVSRVHTLGMLKELEIDCTQGPGLIDPAPSYVTPHSYQAALQAAGASLAVTRAVLQNNQSNAFAIVRPPGHHAEPQTSMGFCLLNNAAIAALDALEHGVERVFVIDYDAHHGNGTQKAFWDNPHAGYFSTHQENIYPGSGGLKDAPHARGRIANFPLPAYSGDKCFSQIFEQNLAPLLRAFQPGLLIISAGFDAHHTDPLTSLGLSTGGFYSISQKLVDLAWELCNGKIVFILEGGYDPTNVANGVRAVFAALAGTQAPQVPDRSKRPEPDISARMKAFQEWHAL